MRVFSASHVHRAVMLVAALSSGVSSASGDAAEEALRRFKPAPGLTVELFASEPQVRQPVAIHYDERGRLWVVQYLQYPDPAGLKKIRVDQYMRTQFDRVPEPPPRGPKGADKITICEDTDGDGRADKFTDFVTGLNMATGVAIGYGGVFVAQCPYLLFYPDRDRDDRPDSDPEVLVAGFGMEDSHAYPNSLQIGPDGWLYGAQGSNVWAKVEVAVGANGETFSTGRLVDVAAQVENRKTEIGDRKSEVKNSDATAKRPISDFRSPISDLPRRTLEFNQCIWRYHPPTRRFEVFAEGGGNTWGCDFDRHGQIIAGTNFGGVAGLHMVQGGYYVKGFAKHGPLSNPHAYGYFEHIPYASPQKISQGEHIMCGGIVYQGGAFGPEIENQYITCALLHRAIYWHKLIPDRSSFKSDFGGTLLTSDDPEFRPVDLALAPDGAVMIADWCDVRANHVIPEDTWNKSNGRIWRLAKQGTPRAAPLDLTRETTGKLVELHQHPNAWFRREARRVLAERGDPEAMPLVRRQLNSPHALEYLWTLYRITEMNESPLQYLATHADEHVRAWGVRLTGDPRRTSKAKVRLMTAMATRDQSAIVRAQLASTAARLGANEGLTIVAALLRRDEDLTDQHLPLLVWWVIERHALSATNETLGLVTRADDWGRPWLRSHVIQRLARRFAAAGTDAGFAACAKLLDLAPSERDRAIVVAGMNDGLAGQSPKGVPAALEPQLARLESEEPVRLGTIRLALRLNRKAALVKALDWAADRKRPETERLEMLDGVAQSARPHGLATLLKLATEDPSDAVRRAALAALARHQDDSVARSLLAAYSGMKPPRKAQVLAMLAARKNWAAALLDAVAAKNVPPSEVTADLAQIILQHHDAALAAKLAQHVGRFNRQTSQQKAAEIARIAGILAAGNNAPSSSDATARRASADRGKPVFAKHCGICHTLFGEGNKIGPDLTGAERGNRDLMLASIVDPSQAIRQEYAASTILLHDGQVLTGIVVEATPTTVTVLDAKNQRTTVARGDIETLKPLDQSLMPEKVLDPLSEQELRDLFAYLETGVQVTAGASQITSSFDVSADGWTLSNNEGRTLPEHLPTGGQSGGCIVVADQSDQELIAVAPSKFHGDLTRFVDGMAWFDAKLASGNLDRPHPPFGVLTLTDGKTTIRQHLYHPKITHPNAEWTRFSGRLTAAAFDTDEATFRAVLGRVSRMTLTLETAANPGVTLHIDNVTWQRK